MRIDVMEEPKTLREIKADLFVEARQASDSSQDQILKENPDLKALFTMLNDFKNDKLSNGKVDPRVISLIDNALSGKGDQGERFTQNIALVMRKGYLDAHQVIDADTEQLVFNKERVVSASKMALELELNFQNRITPNDIDGQANKMNALQEAYPQDQTKSAAIINAVALDMANNALETRAEIIAQAPDIAGAALFYIDQEQNVKTPSEQAALPHINDKLVAMVLDNDPGIAKLNERSQQMLNEMTNEINVESDREITL
jgi:hypothetical protein